MVSKKHKVFVYGTLRENKEATHFLPGYAMFLVDGAKFNFPFIQWMGDRLLDEVGVEGNIIEVDDEGLAKLDKYEGIARGLYERKWVEVFDDSLNEAEEVWVYVGGPQLIYQYVESGDWFNR